MHYYGKGKAFQLHTRPLQVILLQPDQADILKPGDWLLPFIHIGHLRHQVQASELPMRAAHQIRNAILPASIAQNRAQPFFGFLHSPTFAGCIICKLVPADFS